MNANLPQQTPTIKDWLGIACDQLSKIGITSAKLDSEIILAYILGKNRTYLHAHANRVVDKQNTIKANAQLKRRLGHTPIAYIVGNKEFYGREFIVSPDVLIPRPESEDIIDILKQILPATSYRLPTIKLIDVGTGSGCLGITAKLEFPLLDVTLTDTSEKALIVAKQNAKKYTVEINYLQDDLLQNYHSKPNIIIANLPYVDTSWDRSPETNFEPSLALFADKGGLSMNERIIVQASEILTKNGYLVIEADPDQHSHLSECAKKYRFDPEQILNYVIAFKKL
ncbi:MAG: peptide chain release factor N(5)-glutamine methyltransferase [Candidatus Saccharibacteria bacterium]|nr:peptide chain release factor N(5)-glutamine methyltransferase [Candidatus Saccharibacteria bacterium]